MALLRHKAKQKLNKKVYSAAYSTRHFWGSNFPNFLRASLCSAQRLAFARQGKRQSNPPQPLGTQQAPNPLILPRAPGAHAFLKCYICIYVIRNWKNFYKKIFYPRCLSYGFQKYQPQPPITLLDLLNFETQKPG